MIEVSKQPKSIEALCKLYSQKQSIIKEHLNDPKYKTELCRSYLKNGSCSYKNKCRYAHGESELIPKMICNKNYKKILCDKFSKGYCPYGARCQYLHQIRPSTYFLDRSEKEGCEYQRKLIFMCIEIMKSSAVPQINSQIVQSKCSNRLACFEEISNTDLEDSYYSVDAIYKNELMKLNSSQSLNTTISDISAE